MGTLLTVGAMARLNTVDTEKTTEKPAFPETVGPYVLQDRIGCGGMGEVYRAYDRRLDREVAVKHIHPDSADDPKIRRRLRREAHAVARLNHPAIVHIYDILETGDGDWIVMELIEGRSLHDLVKTRQLHLKEALFLAAEVASGLAEAHAKGVVHRDLKTENVMVTPSGHSKILDFGLAKLLLEGAGETILSIHGTIVGTGRAMSPEQAKGEKVDHRSDLFSLGSLLYEMVTGRPPFQGTSIIATLTQICSENAPSARELNPQVPEELSLLIDRLLEKEAEDRPQHTADVAAALTEISSRLDGEAGRSIAATSGPAKNEASGSSALTPTPRSSSRITRAESTSSAYIKTLVSLTLDRPEMILEQLGRSRADEVFLRHDRLVRDLLARWAGTEVSKDGRFLLVLERPSDAVELALSYHRKLSFLAEEIGLDSSAAPALKGRVGIHLGEIFWHEDDPQWSHPPFEVDSAARRTVLRAETMARPGQTLLTQGAYGIARRAFGALPAGEEERVWSAHGKYRFAQLRGTFKVFEVRAISSPLLPPPAETEGIARVGDPSESIDAPSFPSSWSRKEARRGLYRFPGATWAVALTALVLVGAAAVRLAGKRPYAGEIQTITLEELSSLDESADRATQAVLHEMLSTQLSAGEGLQVAGPGPDADFVLSGSYQSLEDVSPGELGRERRLQVRLVLRDAVGSHLLEREESAGEEALFELTAELARQVRRQLGLPTISSQERARTRALWSENPTAARLYAEGLVKARLEKPARARDLLRRSIAHDPAHAPAHAALSEVLIELGDTGLAAKSAQRAVDYGAALPLSLLLLFEGQLHRANAFSFLERSQTEQARQEFEQASQRFADAGDLARAKRARAELSSATLRP